MVAVNHTDVKPLELSLFGRTVQYNDNIKYCGLCSTDISRIENAKYT